MKNRFVIRFYAESDFEAVSELWEITGIGGKHRGDVNDVIIRTIEMGGKLLLMADEKSGELIGTSWLTNDGRRSYLHHFGIRPEYQGQKLSHQLLEATLAEARKTGYQLKLEVHHDNLKAVSLYKKYGFTYLGDYDVYIIRDLRAEE